MTNSERYRAAFACIHAPAGASVRALQHLAKEGAAPLRRRRPLRTLLVLATAAVLLAGSVSAQVTDGAISNLLAPLFGGAQTDLVDDIGYPIDASVSADGFTLTADAVIGDRYHMAVVYTLTRDDGQPIPETAFFDGWSNSVMTGSGGGTLEVHREENAPANQLHFVERWSSAAPLFRRTVKVVFQTLSVRDGADGDARTILAEGPWELSFTLRYRDASVSLPADGLVVTDEVGNPYEIHSILLSPLGLHMELTAPVPEKGSSRSNGSPLHSSFQASLILTDGTRLAFSSSSGGGSWSEGDTVARAHYGAAFETPIPLEDIAALDLCGTEVPVSLS